MSPISIATQSNIQRPGKSGETESTTAAIMRVAVKICMLAIESWAAVRWLFLKIAATIVFGFLGDTAWTQEIIIHLGNLLFRRAHSNFLFLNYAHYVKHYSPTLQPYEDLLPKTEWLSGRTVLDLGAGLCQYSRLLLDGGASRVIALECQQQKVDWSKAQNAGENRLEFLCCSATQIPLPSASIDSVFSHTVFEHLDCIPAVLSSLNRVLKPNGKIVMSYNFIHHSGGHHLFPYIHFPWPLWVVKESALCHYWSDQLGFDQARGEMKFFPDACRIKSLSEGNEIHLNRLNYEQFEEMVRATGFAIIARHTSEQLGKALPFLLRTRVRFFMAGTIFYALEKKESSSENTA